MDNKQNWCLYVDIGTLKQQRYENAGVQIVARCCKVRGIESGDMDGGEESAGSKDSYPYDIRCGWECVCVWKVNGQEPLTLTLGRLSARPLTAVESSAKS